MLYVYVCVCAFSLYREYPDTILGDKLLLFQGEVVYHKVLPVEALFSHRRWTTLPQSDSIPWVCYRLNLGVCWMGLLPGCPPHHRWWVAVSRSCLTAWYMCREMWTITYSTKEAHWTSRPQEKCQQKRPTWVRLKYVLTSLWASLFRFL
jgi:hypothetical protein